MAIGSGVLPGVERQPRAGVSRECGWEAGFLEEGREGSRMPDMYLVKANPDEGR